VLRDWPANRWGVLRSDSRALVPCRVGLLASFFFGLTIITLLFDQPILNFLRSAPGPLTTAVIYLGGAIGDNYHFWCCLLCVYFATKFGNWKKASDVVYAAMLSAGLAAAIGFLVKLIFLRARPAAGFGPFSFFNHTGYAADTEMFLSLPSGDVTLVAGAAASVSFSMNNRRYLRLWVLALPVMTAVSRVSLNRHWPSDTLVAFALGTLVARGLHNWKSRNGIQS